MTNGKPTRRGGGSNRGTPSRRGQGTPKSSTKVTARKTTAKEKTDPITTTDVSPEKCPCGQSDTSSWVLRCIKCTQNWHNNCCNLKGIDKNFVEQLEDWLCPYCFVPPGRTHCYPHIDNLILRTTNLSDDNYNLSKQICSLEEKLSSLISDTDRISSGCDEIARRVVDIDLTDISSGIAHLNIQQDQTSKIIKSVTSKLEQLSAPAQHAAPIMHIPAACDRPEPSAEPVHIIDQHAEILPKFIGDSEEQAILNFLLAHDTQFKAENGHSVLSFGHPYSYVGSKSTSNPPELPEVLQPLVNKLNIIQKREYEEKFPNQPKNSVPLINSCLVNKYTGPEAFLSEHADDEVTIHPESSIFTISLGASCSVTFTDKRDNSESVITPGAGSLYQMTRRSQEIYKHRIDAGSIDGVRFSLTFRAVNWKNRNCTAIVGDSNTGGLIFGNSKSNSFGELMPGQRFWAPKIGDINPADYVGYSNVVISCGINDLKLNHIKSRQDVGDIYQRYRLKIKQIRSVNRRANIFVVPVLPTGSHEFNQRAIDFNRMLFDDMSRSGLGVGVEHVSGLDSLLDSNGLLSGRFSRRFDKNGRRDVLHLNHTGTRYFARLIKSCIFSRLNRSAERRKSRRSSGSAGPTPPPPPNIASTAGLTDGCQV